MTKLHFSSVPKMRLIRPLKFGTLKTGCFKMPCLQTPRLKMTVFQTGITVASVLLLVGKAQKVTDFNLIATFQILNLAISHYFFLTEATLLSTGVGIGIDRWISRILIFGSSNCRIGH